MTNAVSLEGIWRLGWFDGRRGDRAFVGLPDERRNRWLDAVVPGEIHRDLIRQEVIGPIEPGLGALAARWMEDCVWYLERDVDHAPEPGEIVELVFDRLELDTVVYLNEQVIGRHRNAFRPLRIDVSRILVSGINRLRVELDGGLQAVRDLPARGYRHKPEQGLTKRHWLRTGQSQFSWDWSPRLVTMGITGPVRLERRDAAVRIEYVVPIVAVSDDHGTAAVTCRVHLLAGESTAAAVVVRMPGLGREVRSDVAVPIGESNAEVVVEIIDPPLWWPVGMGAQHLVDLEVELEVSGRVVDRRTQAIGLRTVTVDTSPADDGGSMFRLVVNGRPFFAKGANWVPISLTPNPVDTRLLGTQLDRAVEANFTLLRVWGGGDYETEEFYRGCDERGLLVWQDFIFACSRYPLSDGAFAAEAAREARHQVRRLASHPSLAIWAGNNEIAWIGLSPGWPGPLSLVEDGVPHDEMAADHLFFERDLPAMIRAEDPTRFYQPSSPWSPTGDDHNDFHQGDQHPWQVGFDEVDFLQYRRMDARFPNEGGLLGPASLAAVEDSLRGAVGSDDAAYDSFAWKTHENEVTVSYADRPLDTLVAEWTGMRPEESTLAEYVYWGGLVQAEALTEYIDNFRRRPLTGAAVFWMYNDCWPTVRSWSIVDWKGRRSPAFFPVRRAFSPVRVVIVDDGTTAGVHVCNDRPEAVELELEIGTTTLGGAVDTRRIAVAVRALSTARVASTSRPAGEGTVVIAVLRTQQGEVISRNRLLAGVFAALPWQPAVIEIEHGVGWSTYRSGVFVLGVCLDLDGDLDLSDNFFDLYPGLPHTVTWAGDTPPGILFTGNAAVQRA